MTKRFSRIAVLAVSTSMTVLLASPLASAQTATPSRPGDTGYGYNFTDPDLLRARAPGAEGDRFGHRTRVRRTTLIAPRTSFVPDIFKSAEKM